MQNLLVRWSQIEHEFAAIEHFLEWCEQAHGLQLDFDKSLVSRRPVELLIYEYFQLDPNQLELARDERRQRVERRRACAAKFPDDEF